MLVLWLLDLFLQCGVAFQRQDVLPWPNWNVMYNASQLVQETKNKIQASRTLLESRTTPQNILQEHFWRHRVKSNDFNEVLHEKGSIFTRPLYSPEGSTDSYSDSYEASIESGQGDELNNSTDSDYDSDSSDHRTSSDPSEDGYANRTKRCITLLPLLLSPQRKSYRQLSSERDDRLTSYRNNMLESPRRKHNSRRKQHFKSDLRSSYKYPTPNQGDADMYENSESGTDTQTKIISTKNGAYNNIFKYFTPPDNTLARTYGAQYSGGNKLFQCIEKCKQGNLAEKIQGNEVQLQDKFGEKSSESKDVPYNMLQMEPKTSETDAELRSKEIDYIMDQSSHHAQEKTLLSESLDTYSSKLNCSYLRPEIPSVNPQRDQENDTDEEYFEYRNWTLKTMNDKQYIVDKCNEESEILTYPSDTEIARISTKEINNNFQAVTDTMNLDMLQSDTLNHNVMAKQDSIPAEQILMYDDPQTTNVLSQNIEVHQEMPQPSFEDLDSSLHRSQDRYASTATNTETNVKSYFYVGYPNTQETRQNNRVKEFEYHDNYNANDHPGNEFDLQGDKGNSRGTESIGAQHTLDDKITHESQLSMGYSDTSHESQGTSYFSTGNNKQNGDEGNRNIHSSTKYLYTADESTEDTEHYDSNEHKTELFMRYNIPRKFPNPNGVARHMSHDSDGMTGDTQSLTGYTDGSNESEDTRRNNKHCYDSSDTDAEPQLTDSSSEDNNEFHDLPEFNVGKQRETYNDGHNTNRGSLDSNDYQDIQAETQSSTDYLGVSDGDIQGFTNHLYLNGFSNNDEQFVGDKQGSYSSQYMNSQIQSSRDCSYTKSELCDASQHIITTYDPPYEVNQSPIEHPEVQNEYQNTGEHFSRNFYYSNDINRDSQLYNTNSNTSNDFQDTSENYEDDFPDKHDFRNMKGEMHEPATSSEVLRELKETGEHFKHHEQDPYVSDNTSRKITLSLDYFSNSSEFQDIHESSISNKGSSHESQDSGGEVVTSINILNFPNREYYNDQKDSYDSSDIETKLSTLCSRESYKSENTKECFSSEDSQVLNSSNGENQLISKYTDNVNEFQDDNEYAMEDERSPHVSGDLTVNTQSTLDFSECSNGFLNTHKHSMDNEQEPQKACDVREDTESSSKYLEILNEFQDTSEQFIGDQVLYGLNNRDGETESYTEFSDDSNEFHDTVEDFEDADLGRTEVSTEYTFILYKFQDAGENSIVKNDLHNFGDINRQTQLSTKYPETHNEFQIHSEYEEDSYVDTNGNTEIFNKDSDTQDELLNNHYTGDSETENSDTGRTQPFGQHSDSNSEDNNEYELGDSKISHTGTTTLESSKDVPFPPTPTSSEEFSTYVLRLESENISPQLQENNQFYEDSDLSRGDTDKFEDETSTSLRYDSENTEITSVWNKTHRTSSSNIQLQELHEDTVYIPFENKNDIELFTRSSIQYDNSRYNSDGPFITQEENSESEFSSEQSGNTDDSLSSWVTNLRYPVKDKSNEMEYSEDGGSSFYDETEDFYYNKQEKCKTRIPIIHTYNNGQNKGEIQTTGLSDESFVESMTGTREPDGYPPRVIERHYYLTPVYIVTPHPSTQVHTIISPFSDEEDNLGDGGENLTLTENKAETEQILKSNSDYEKYYSNTDTFKPITSNKEDNTLLSEAVPTGPIMRHENNLLLSSNGQATGDRNGYTNKINSFSDDLKGDSFTTTQIAKNISNQILHDYLLGDQSLSSDTSQDMELISHSDMADSSYSENAAWKEHNIQEEKPSLETDKQIESFYSGRSYNVLDAIYNAHPTLEPPYTSRPIEYLVGSRCFQPGCSSTLFGEFVKKIVEEKIEEYHKQIHRKCDQCAATPIQTKDNLFLDKIERASLTKELDDNGVVLGKAPVSENGEVCNSYIAMKLDAVMNMLIGLKEWLMNSSAKGK